MDRRKFLHQSSMAGGAVLLSKMGFGKSFAGKDDFPVVRIPASKRRSNNATIESTITSLQNSISNKELAWLFGNCFPNTLDTTVEVGTLNGKPDTFVITGDIDAMWLRDSTAQVWPYLPFAKKDPEIKKLIEGVIRRQVECISLDPYANAFYKNESKVSEWKSDLTDMKPGVHERKWEIDSLCYAIRLSYGYWKETGDSSIFDDKWNKAMLSIVQTFKEQQRIDGNGPYHFQRDTPKATDTLPLSGYGYPTKPVGLICSMFRPSDDATIFPFLIPSNLFAVKSLQNLAEIWRLNAMDNAWIVSAQDLARQVWQAVEKYGVTYHPKYGKIYVYETNGYGSFNMMDDANVPSLLSLPYLDAVGESDQVYANTRKFVLSEDNPFYFKGTAAAGLGSPHTGMDMIWPIGIIMQGLTSKDPNEIKQCLQYLQTTHASTGFMHESFNKDVPLNFSRKWFAWANTLFGEFILKVYKEHRSLLS